MPACFATFNSNSQIEKEATVLSETTKPYVIEVHKNNGELEGSFSGNSILSDPFLISKEIGAKPYPEDKFSAFPAIKMRMGSKITIYRAPAITVIDGKREMIYRSWSKTVGEMLSEKDIELGDDDKINFAKDVPLENNMLIKIIRVAITTMRERKPIDYQIIRQEDNTLDEGKTRLEQSGEKGTKVYAYEVQREDGVEVSRRLINTKIEKKPVDEILIIGTKPVITGWCAYNDWVLDASARNGLNPNRLCDLMKMESFGNADSVGQGGAHQGLFQYDPGFWSSVSVKAGYSGASIWDARSQIYVTAWAVTHGYAGRWPGTFK